MAVIISLAVIAVVFQTICIIFEYYHTGVKDFHYNNFTVRGIFSVELMDDDDVFLNILFSNIKMHTLLYDARRWC